MNTTTPCNTSYKIKEIALPVFSSNIKDINNVEQVVNSLKLENLVVSYEPIELPVTLANPCDPTTPIATTATAFAVKIIGTVHYSVLIFEVATSALAGLGTTDFINMTYGYVPPTELPNPPLDSSKFTAKLTLDDYIIDTTTSNANTIFLINGTMSLTYNG